MFTEEIRREQKTIPKNQSFTDVKLCCRRKKANALFVGKGNL